MCSVRASLRSLRRISSSRIKMYAFTAVLCLQTLLTSEASKRSYNKAEELGFVTITFEHLNSTQCKQLNNNILVRAALDQLFLRTKLQRRLIDLWRQSEELQITSKQVVASSEIVHSFCSRHDGQADKYRGEVLFFLTHPLAQVCKLLDSLQEGVIPSTVVLPQLQFLSPAEMKETLFGAENITFAAGSLADLPIDDEDEDDDLPIDDEDRYGSGSGFWKMNSSDTQSAVRASTATPRLHHFLSDNLPVCKPNYTPTWEELETAVKAFVGCLIEVGPTQSSRCVEKFTLQRCRVATPTTSQAVETTPVCNKIRRETTGYTQQTSPAVEKATPLPSQGGRIKVHVLFSIVLPIIMLAAQNI